MCERERQCEIRVLGDEDEEGRSSHFGCLSPTTCLDVEGRCKATWKRESHGARPVHLIIMMIKWIRTSRLSIKNSLSAWPRG